MRECRVGSDTVREETGRLVVFCRVRMPEWEVRKFRRTRILYDGRAFVVSKRNPQPDGSVRYTLEPWPEDTDPPLQEIEYNEDLVRLRDEQWEEVRQARVRLGLLSPVVPFVGFLPSNVKKRLHETWGIHPDTATAFSLWLEYLMLLGLCALLAISAFTGVFSPVPLIVTLIVFAVDATVRRNSLMAENEPPFGFYEWLFRMKLW